jgi:hypothetical protein
MARLRIPAVLAVAVVGGATVGIIAASCGYDEPPSECTVDGGVCPTDGKLCLDEQTRTQPCCPLCPVEGTCPNGCVLDLPPI